jgi:peptide/nickel transport system ATP-binding protein
MLITHDLGVVAETCDEVVVMYAGRAVERAITRDLFATPRHHYTAGLLRSVPSYSGGPGGGPYRDDGEGPGRLQEIPGMVPSLHQLPPGCKFQDRCEAKQDKCVADEPALAALGDNEVRCHFPVESSR